MKLFPTLPFLLLVVAGCSTFQRPPSATEQKYFVVTTNYTPVVEARTNAVVVSDPVTQLPVTNYVPIYVTNLQPAYVFTPNTNTGEIATTIGAITNTWAPGFGGLAAAIAGGLFGLYGSWRSRKSNQATAALAQIIETGEQILLSLPNGAAVAQQWKAWMVKHQAETDTISKVSKLVATVVDTESARRAAADIQLLIERAKA